MRVLVTYLSATGNTGELAHAIFHSVIHESHKQLLPVEQAGEFDDPDVVFVGFPVYQGGLPDEIAAYLRALPDGTKLALFCAHGSYRGGERVLRSMVDALDAAAGKTVLGTFSCQGEVPAEVIDGLHGHPEHVGWLLDAKASIGHPDAAERDEAREFARHMLVKARVL
jgi:flavodoxin